MTGFEIGFQQILDELDFCTKVAARKTEMTAATID